MKNDYAQFGAEFEVMHHTQIIADLLRQGRLKLAGQKDDRIVFHDSCYLGRYNGIYQEPRDVLAAATGERTAGDARSREGSFCCGAGGGRMWMDEDIGNATYRERTGEALQLDPTIISVACPYCMIMLEDGLRDEGKTGTVKVKDVAEIVAAAMR